MLKWRLGYYSGVTANKWSEYVRDGHGWGQKDDNWIWIADGLIEWETNSSDGLPCPVYKPELFDELCNGFVWAIVKTHQGNPVVDLPPDTPPDALAEIREMSKAERLERLMR